MASQTYHSEASLANRQVLNTYDKTYRLLEEQAEETGVREVVTSYTYDKANNRTGKTVDTTPDGGSTTTATHIYTYGNSSNGFNSNQLCEWDEDGTTTHTYQYDANGNRICKTLPAIIYLKFSEGMRWFTSSSRNPSQKGRV